MRYPDITVNTHWWSHCTHHDLEAHTSTSALLPETLKAQDPRASASLLSRPRDPRGQKGGEAARLGMAGMRGGRKAGLMAEVLCEWIFTGSTADLPQGQTRGGDSWVARGRANQPRSWKRQWGPQQQRHSRERASQEKMSTCSLQPPLPKRSRAGPENGRSKLQAMSEDTKPFPLQLAIRGLQLKLQDLIIQQNCVY